MAWTPGPGSQQCSGPTAGASPPFQPACLRAFTEGGLPGGGGMEAAQGGECGALGSASPIRQMPTTPHIRRLKAPACSLPSTPSPSPTQSRTTLGPAGALELLPSWATPAFILAVPISRNFLILGEGVCLSQPALSPLEGHSLGPASWNFASFTSFCRSFSVHSTGASGAKAAHTKSIHA